MTNKKYLIKTVEVCSECSGKGFLIHPAWVEYHKENQGGASMTLEDERKWFEDHGWYVTSSIYMRSDGIPDETTPCGECEGEGEIVRGAPRSALRDVLVHQIVAAATTAQQPKDGNKHEHDAD